MSRWHCMSLFVACLLASNASAQSEQFLIRGRVLDAASKPLSGARVRLLAPGISGVGNYDVNENTTTDVDGKFHVAAPRTWVLMDASSRQELSLVATDGKRFVALQFDRFSAPPNSEIALVLPEARAEFKTVVHSPEGKPVAGARLHLVGLLCDKIRVDFTEAELKELGERARKTPHGYAIGQGIVSLPEELQFDLGQTDSKGLARIENIPAAQFGGVKVQSEEFGAQTIAHFSYQGSKAPDWPTRLVLKKVGRLEGHLTGPGAKTFANRKINLATFQIDETIGVYHGSEAKVVTDQEGKFSVPKMMAGTVQFNLEFDPDHPTRPDRPTNETRLKANETLQLKIALKPAVNVVGRVLDADTKKPVRDVRVRAFLGVRFETKLSDAEGRFAFWMPPGQTAFHPEIPEGYLPPLSPTESLDAANDRHRAGLITIPELKTFETPPIFLRKQVTARGIVADSQGKPLAGAVVSGVSLYTDRRTGQPRPRERIVRTNESGEFAIDGLDPRESLRLRAQTPHGSKLVTVSKPGSETVRIVVAAGEQFTISGRVTDAAGKPFADAALEIWHRDWRPAPAVGEPKKLDLTKLPRTDALGQFTTPPLLPDGFYRFTIRAPGAKTAESPWIDATRAESATAQKLIASRLGGLAGVVRDRNGQTLAGAALLLLTKDSRAETVSNRQGEFTLEAPTDRPFCVVVRHRGYRTGGSFYEIKPAQLDQILIRLSEPGEKLAPRSLLSKDEREKLQKQLGAILMQRLAKSKNTDDKMSTLQSLSRVTPDFVSEFVDKFPLSQAEYNEMLLTQVAHARAVQNSEDAEELIGRLKLGAHQTMAYNRLVDALSDKDRSRKLGILAEGLVAARSEREPEFRAVALGQVAHRLFLLGEKERAVAIFREGEKIANGLSTDAFAGFTRASFATDLADIDLPAALALMKDLKDRSEFARHHGNTAHRLAGKNSAEAIRVLNMLITPQANEIGQRDHYALRMCYRMSQRDLPAALKLVDSIVDIPSRAYALGVTAQGIARQHPKQAAELIQRAFSLLEEYANHPLPEQLTSSLTEGSAACGLILLAAKIDPSLIPGCLWQCAALQRPVTQDRKLVWRHTSTNYAIAMACVRYNPKLAEFILPKKPEQGSFPEANLVQYLINPRNTIDAILKEPNAATDRRLADLMGYLATDEQQMDRLIFNSLGMWRIDVEDLDM